jgi:outer membrane receptor protein involved in Fe transport
MNKRCPLFLIAASILILSTFLSAGTTGKISGKVTDSKTREGIPSAVVSVVGTTLGAATDFEGNYVIVNVPPGTYSIAVSYVGYQPTRINNIGVNVDYTTTLNIQLKESAVELTEFVVEGERNPLIRQDQTNPVVAVTAENIQALPVTSISQIVGLQAGVVTADDGSLHVRGGRSNEIAYTLNGMSVNDPYNNLSSIGVATNAVQEVTVSTGTFSAEYGNALSGVVNFVTKEGGDRNTGSLRLLTGDYYTKHTDIFPHLDKYQAFNSSRAEITFGGPTLLDNLTFYLSGVVDRSNGYLIGERLYNPTDMFVRRNEFTKQYLLKDSLGQTVNVYGNESRRGGVEAPYYFDPLRRQIIGYTFLRRGDTLMSPVFDPLGGPTGDRALVPLNTNEAYNIQGNIAYRLSSTLKFKYEFVFDKAQSQSSYYYPSTTNFSYRYNPDGRPTNFSKGSVHALDITHTLDNSTFYTLKASYNSSTDKTYTFEDIYDPRYLPAFYQTELPIVGFLTGGTDLNRSFRTSSAVGAKFDLQTQLYSIHEVKVGAELRQHTIDLESYTMEFYNLANPDEVINDFHDVYTAGLSYRARIPNVESGYIKYVKEPVQFSAYIQDKIEIDKTLILNAGIRYEYFDPAAQYNPFLSEAISRKDTSFLYKELIGSSIKHTFSPRISIAYPITDQGVLRFSYGHFYQLGNLSSLYTNPNFRVAGTPTFGNSNVRPQRSVQYEMGLQQGLTQDLRLEVVGFYKDVRDYIYNQLVVTAKSDVRYRVLTNLDYSNARGLTISLFQRRAPGSMISSSLDYTFSVAEGNRTEPAEDFFFSERSGKSVETFLVPLSYDRTHTLTATLGITIPENFSINNTFRLQSGTPYTASIPASLSTQLAQFVQNSSTKPFQFTVDVKAEKYLSFSGMNYSIFIQIDNLFDTKNEISVYPNSGKALYNANEVAFPAEFNEVMTRIERGDVGLVPISAVDNYYVDPTNISKPRLIRLGLSMMF